MIAAPLCDNHILLTSLRELRERGELYLKYIVEAQPCSFFREPTRNVAEVEFLSKNVLSVDK
jgi:hypothetical protein